jgi:hypothetical protein
MDEYEKGFRQGWYDYFCGEEFPVVDKSLWMKGYQEGWKQGVRDEEVLLNAETLIAENYIMSKEVTIDEQ